MIPHLHPITTPVRRLHERLWQLVERDTAGTATVAELAELDALCARLEYEEDEQ